MPKILPVFIPFSGCKTKCVYCNQNSISGQFVKNLHENVLEQIEYFLRFNTKWDEISFFGGSFSCLPEESRLSLYNIARQKGLLSIRFSTRPDCISEEMLSEFKVNNVKVIELGIQSLSDKVLASNNRPYSKDLALESIDKLTKAGFDVVAQIMTGMYKEDFCDLKYTVDELRIKDIKGVRIYPTVVLKDTKLAEYLKEGKFTPLSFEETFLRTAYAYIKFASRGVEILRIGLQDGQSLKNSIISGVYFPAFGDMIKTFIVILYLKYYDKLLVGEAEIKKLPNYKGILKKYFSDKIISVNNSEKFSIKDICAKLEIITGEDNWGQSEREVAKFAKEIWNQADNRPA